MLIDVPLTNGKTYKVVDDKVTHCEETATGTRIWLVGGTMLESTLTAEALAERLDGHRPMLKTRLSPPQ